MLFISFLIQIEQKAKNESEYLESLLLKIADGDKTAFKDFYTKTRTSVYSFAMSILKSPYNAEDVMHDTYVKLYSCAGIYNPCGKPMSWLLTIVRNYCLMYIRKEKRVGELPEDFDIPEDDGNRHVDNKNAVAYAMTILNDSEKQIVTLHAISGLKHREIADFLNIPLSTVLSTYNRALKKMKKLFEAQEETL